jgi:hypothetical protein
MLLLCLLLVSSLGLDMAKLKVDRAELHRECEKERSLGVVAAIKIGFSLRLPSICRNNRELRNAQVSECYEAITRLCEHHNLGFYQSDKVAARKAWKQLREAWDPTAISVKKRQLKELCVRPKMFDAKHHRTLNPKKQAFCMGRESIAELIKTHPAELDRSDLQICSDFLAEICTVHGVGHYEPALVKERVEREAAIKREQKFYKEFNMQLRAWDKEIAQHAKHASMIKKEALEKARICSYDKEDMRRRYKFCKKSANWRQLMIENREKGEQFCLWRTVRLCKHHGLRKMFKKRKN